MSVIPFYFFDGSQSHCATFADLYGEQLSIALGSESTALFTVERRQTAINNAMYAWVQQTQCIKRKPEVFISSGVAEYDIESTIGDFLELATAPSVKIVSAGGTRYIQGDDLPERTPEWLDRYEEGWRASTGGTPHCWYVTDEDMTQKIGLHPAPVPRAGETWSLVVPVLIAPSRMTLDTQSPFMVQGVILKRLCPWGWALPLHAAAQLEPLRKNMEAVADLTNKWNAAIARFLARRTHQGPDHVTYTRNYYHTSTGFDRKDPRR